MADDQALAHIANATRISNLVGLDVSERCVELTRQKVAAEVYQAPVLDDATVERFRGSFDFDVMAAVLPHVVGATKRRSYRAASQAVSNAMELVKPGGYLIVMEPTFTPAVAVFILFWVKTMLTKVFHRRLPVGDYWNNIGAPVVSYYSHYQVMAMLRTRPDIEMIQADNTPQALSTLAELLVSKSNTTMIAMRQSEPVFARQLRVWVLRRVRHRFVQRRAGGDGRCRRAAGCSVLVASGGEQGRCRLLHLHEELDVAPG